MAAEVAAEVAAVDVVEVADTLLKKPLTSVVVMDYSPPPTITRRSYNVTVGEF